MRQRGELFTTNYGVQYDNWISISPQNLVGGFFQSFTRGTFTINVSTPVYYLLVQILDADGNQKYFGYIRTIDQYKAVKKKLKWV